VVIGGLITGTILTLFIFPLIFERTYRAEHSKYGPQPELAREQRELTPA